MHLHLPGDQATDPARERVLVQGGVWMGDGPVPEHLAKLGVRAKADPFVDGLLASLAALCPPKRLSNADHGRKGAECEAGKEGGEVNMTAREYVHWAAMEYRDADLEVVALGRPIDNEYRLLAYEQWLTACEEFNRARAAGTEDVGVFRPELELQETA